MATVPKRPAPDGGAAAVATDRVKRPSNTAGAAEAAPRVFAYDPEGRPVLKP